MSSSAEGGEDAVAQVALPVDRGRSVSEYALMKLSGTATSAPAVCDREVVEDEQFAGTQADLNADGFGMKFAVREKPQLVGEARELRAAEEAWLGLDAGQHGWMPDRCLDDPRKASLAVAGGIVPGAVAGAVGGKATEQLITIGSLASREQ